VSRRIHAPAVRDAAVALVVSRALVWVAGVSAWLLFRLSGDVRFDHDGLTHSFGSVGNALAAPAVRWDSNWYVDIAQHGYRHESVEPAFFPLYPLLMRGLGEVVGSVVVAGVAISLVAFFVALVLLHRLTELELGPEVARRAPLLLALFPTSLFFSAVYTEALFLALELGAFVAARRGRWALAGALGGLGAATRNTGWLLAPVLLALYLYGPRGDPPAAGGRAPAGERTAATSRLRERVRPRYPLRADALWIALVPLGLAGYLIFMRVHFGDLLAPWHAQAHFRRVFEGPLSAYWHGAEKAWDGLTGILSGDPFGPAARKIGQFAVITGALAATVGVLRRLPAAYGLYALLSIVPVLSFPYPPGPLASSLRYVVVVFPLFMWLALRLPDRRAYVATLAVFAAMLVYSAGMFATWHFVA
jgi:hypothetical protein